MDIPRVFPILDRLVHYRKKTLRVSFLDTPRFDTPVSFLDTPFFDTPVVTDLGEGVQQSSEDPHWLTHNRCVILWDQDLPRLP